ncbi:MAG: tRNA pseudouridine(38-40) synthase TruA [Deltaproteobacteria bacterium]|nr:tRNA pseudouridine(38-40) synthase TruA [Deltaproteobacteria bacterium]
MSESQRIRFVVAYEGGGYAGWQRQSNALTVQEVIEQAFAEMTGHEARLMGAGRTDAGVHGMAQVFSIDNPSRHGPEALMRGMNAILPNDVVLREAVLTAPDFDPRREAQGKHYRYTIHSGEVAPLFHRRLRWHLRMPLDLKLMETEAQVLVGEHDFSAFRGADCGAKSPVRRIDLLRIQAQGACFHVHVLGQSFLKHMVRNIVGSLVEVGRGFQQAGWLAEVLASRDRNQAGPTAPAKGLCLMRVFYDEAAYALACAQSEQVGNEVFIEI